MKPRIVPQDRTREVLKHLSFGDSIVRLQKLDTVAFQHKLFVNAIIKSIHQKNRRNPTDSLLLRGYNFCF